jgi:hypothetical protein
MTQKIDQLQYINRDLNYEKINKCLHQENNYAMKFQICISRSTGGVNYLGIHTIRQNPVLRLVLEVINTVKLGETPEQTYKMTVKPMQKQISYDKKQQEIYLNTQIQWWQTKI